MIIELTKENLLNSGCNEAQANELFNSITDYKPLCNNGVFYVSKSENMVYTGIDFYRKEYFENRKNIGFPFNCPNLITEYFDLSLKNYLDNKKELLKTMYVEFDQRKDFILKEIECTDNHINYNNDILKKHNNLFAEDKIKVISIFKAYINFLNRKLLEQPEPTNTEMGTPYLGQPTNENANKFFDYLIENYRPTETTQVKYVNIQHYLKNDADKDRYIFRTKQNEYKKLIKQKTNIVISKFAKSENYNEVEKPILNTLERNFLKIAP